MKRILVIIFCAVIIIHAICACAIKDGTQRQNSTPDFTNESWSSSGKEILEEPVSSAQTYAPTQDPGLSANNESILITVGEAVFTAKLYNNDAANALIDMLPMSLDMSELNSNEKYCYLPRSLPNDAQPVNDIAAGDIMLYGSDCLVLFYESFTTSYNYTKLGFIEDAAGLSAAVGGGDVNVSFTAK